MKDAELIALLEARSDRAAAALEETYGAYCRAIARNILRREEDAEECVNDTLLSAWNAIPPARPESLRAWLGTVARNAALGRLRQRDRVESLQEELAESLPNQTGVAETVEARALGEAVSAFLRSQSPAERTAFVRRYWYCDGIADVARHMGWSESKTKSVLFRTRKKLKEYLEKEDLWHG